MIQKNFPLFLVSMLCLFLMILLVILFLENHHYETVLVDNASKIITARYNELETRFNQAEINGNNAFSEIDRILTSEQTSVEELQTLLNQMDRRLEKADELLQVLAYPGKDQ